MAFLDAYFINETDQRPATLDTRSNNYSKKLSDMKAWLLRIIFVL